MAKAARNGASSRSQVTKDSGKRPSAKKSTTLPVGESQSEAAEIETRRAVAIKRLESLHEKSEVDLLYMSQSVDGQGRPAGGSRVSGAWPCGHDEWPGEDCRSLWQETCDLVDAEFDSNEPDGGLSAWLFSRTQQKWMPTGIQAVVNDPLGKWLERLRSPDPTGPIVCSAMIVTSNPKAATKMDLLAVSSKAHVLAHVLRKQCDDVKRCETRIGDYRRDMRRESESLVELRDMFRREHASQVRQLKRERSNLRHWTDYAEIVVHYASALIPDELSKCRQLSATMWNRPDPADWDELERELDLISSRLMWLPAPCGEGGTLNVNSTQPEPDDSTTRVVPVLSEKGYLILEAMLEMGAISPDTRQSTQEVAIKCDGKEADVNAFKPLLSEFTIKLNLTCSKTGSGGGVWLTDKGIQVTNLLLENRKSSQTKR